MQIELNETQKRINWLSDSIYLNAIAQNAKKRIVRRGEIYWCNFGKGIGSEQSELRPALVLQFDLANTKSPNTIVAPITHSESILPTVVPINSQYDSNGQLILDGYALLGNIMTISKARLGDYITKLSNDEIEKIDEAIITSLGLGVKFKSLQTELNNSCNKIKNIQKSNATLREQNVNMQKRIEELQKELDSIKKS